MEELRLSETELRYFGDLFLCCDVEKTGKISTLKATELFRSANLSNDVVKQIMALVGIPQTLPHLSRKQFYSCLKLIAAHQASIQLRQEVITSSATLPLPRFSWKDSPTPMSSTDGVLNERSGACSSTDDGNGSPEPTNININNLNDGLNSDQPSTDSEVEQNDTQRRIGSPENWSTASDSPTPTNSAAERPWVKDTLWQGLLCEEQRQLLGTEEESSDRHSSDEDNDIDLDTIYQITPEQKEYYIKQFRAVQPDLNGLLAGHVARIFFEKSRIPIEELRHIWQLCDVTRDNALSLGEFTAAMHLVVLRRNTIPLPSHLPPCLLLAITGGVGSTSVEKVDPPEADLLNLGDDIANSGLTTVQTKPSKISSPVTLISNTNINNNITNNNTTIITNVSERLSPSQQHSHHQQQPHNQPQLPDKEWTTSNKQWTKFPESPTTSNVSSPGPKPVNFDMQRTAQAVVSDPQILHPVPLRVTPVGGATMGGTAASAMSTSLTGPDSIDDELSNNRHYTRTKSINNNDNLVFTDTVTTSSRELNDSSPKQSNLMQQRDSLQNDIRPIQRPQPKKIPQKNIGALPPPPQRETSITSTTVTNETTACDLVLNNTINIVSTKKDHPPPPPPRPHRHARSSSLDLNKLKLNTPPEIPPRVSPQTSVDVQMEVENPSFADFAQFSNIEGDNKTTNSIQHDPNNIQAHPRPTISLLQTSQRTSAFEVYRKPGCQNSQSPNNCDGSGYNFGRISTSNLTSTATRTSDYEKRVSSITDNLKHVSFKQDKNLNEILKHLKEQNSLLLKLCNDLSEELLIVQQRKEEIRSRLDHHVGVGGGGDTIV